MRNLIIILCVVIFFTGGLLSQERLSTIITEAEKMFFNKRYISALEQLKRALNRKYVAYEDLEQVYLLMALCQMRQNKIYLAESQLEEALEINADITLDPEKYEQDLIDFVENMKDESIGDVYFVSYPAGASVYVNGRLRGETPLQVRHLTSEIKAYIIKEGYNAETRSITVFPEETTKVVIRLKWNDFSSTVIVKTEPQLVEVYNDDQFKGDSPLIITGLIPGRYRLTFKKKGYYTREDLLVVQPRELQELNIELLKIRDRFILSELFPGLGQFVQGYPKHGVIFSALWVGYWYLYREKVTYYEYKYQNGSYFGTYPEQRVLSNGEVFTIGGWQRARSREHADFDRTKRNMILLGLAVYTANLVDMSWILWYDMGKRLYEEQKKFGFDFKIDNEKVALGFTLYF